MENPRKPNRTQERIAQAQDGLQGINQYDFQDVNHYDLHGYGLDIQGMNQGVEAYGSEQVMRQQSVQIMERNATQEDTGISEDEMQEKVQESYDNFEADFLFSSPRYGRPTLTTTRGRSISIRGRGPIRGGESTCE